MATQPDPGDPMRVIERELAMLRRNVEQELVTGLREKLHKIILDTFMEVAADVDLVNCAAAKKSTGRPWSKGFDRVSTPTNRVSTPLRMAASAEHPNDFGARMPGLSPPVPPCLSLVVTDLTNVTDVMEYDDASDSLPLILPNCVGKTSLTIPEISKESSKKEGRSDELDSAPTDSQTNSCTSDLDFSAQRSDMSEPESPTRRRKSVAESVESLRLSITGSVLLQDDEAILQRTGVLWAPDPKTHRMARVVRNDMFDYAMGAVLVINSICIGMRVDWEASNLGAADLPLYVWMDRAFCVVFLSELCLRIYTFRLAFYITEGWQWAYFDTVVVAFQVLEEVVLIAAGDSAMNLGFLKMLKMGRLMRMVRMIRLLPELKSLVLLIVASMSSFMWTCFLLMLLIYMIAVYMVMMTVDSLQKTIGQTSDSRDELQLYWGSVGSAVLSCYWCITGGQDWAVVIGPLVTETGSQVHNVVFSMFVAFATMVLMNLVTGVFVEGAQRLTKEDRDKDLSKMAHKVFRMVDDDHSEDISREEFQRHMENGQLDNYLAAVDLDKNTADNLFEILDSDHTDTIDVNEFIEGCLRLRGLPRSADVAMLLLETRKADTKRTQAHDSLQQLIRETQSELKQLRHEMWNEWEDC